MMKFHRVLSLALAASAVAACSRETSPAADSVSAAGDTGSIASTVTADTGAPASATGAAPTTGMLDPNAASAADLGTIAGVTSALAAAVVAARPYTTMVAVDKVLAGSLNEQQRDSVYTRLWIPIDLNTATGEEILLIPGIGPRMRHEFEEYRPYTSMAQFRREIGKYVDKNEVARLERYVVIR